MRTIEEWTYLFTYLLTASWKREHKMKMSIQMKNVLYYSSIRLQHACSPADDIRNFAENVKTVRTLSWQAENHICVIPILFIPDKNAQSRACLMQPV